MRTLTLVPLLAATLLAAAPGARAEESDQAAMMEMMKKWEAVMNPSDDHKRLDALVGTWDTVTQAFPDPSKPPMTTRGKAEIAWILGGRFLQEELTGTMAMPSLDGGMKERPFAGLGLYGFDVYRKLYVGVWIDSGSTHVATMKGTCDAEGKAFTFYGELDEPTLDVIGRHVKYVRRILGPDKHVFEIYDLHAGEGYKALEVTYTRRKP